MALSTSMEKAMNDQINAEFESAYLYLGMAAWLESANFPGFAQWMRAQAQEETEHAMKFFEHIVERGGTPTLTAIKAPPKSWQSPLAAFQASYKHEQYISGRINKLMDMAVKAKDYASQSLLQWFIDEQVEEEASVDEIVQKLKMVKGSAGSLLMFDHKLGKRGKE